MNLDAALSIANSGLANVQSPVRRRVAQRGERRHAALCHRDQHAAEPGRRRPGNGRPHRADHAPGRCRPAGSLTAQNGTVAGLQTQQTALQAIDAVQGTVGQGNDLGSLLATCSRSSQRLLNSPAARRSRPPWSARRRRWRRASTASAPPTPRSGRRRRTTSSPRSARSTRRSARSGSLSAADHDAAGQRPEHRRPGEPARRGGADTVAAGRRQDAGCSRTATCW